METHEAPMVGTPATTRKLVYRGDEGLRAEEDELRQAHAKLADRAERVAEARFSREPEASWEKQRGGGKAEAVEECYSALEKLGGVLEVLEERLADQLRPPSETGVKTAGGGDPADSSSPLTQSIRGITHGIKHLTRRLADLSERVD